MCEMQRAHRWVAAMASALTFCGCTSLPKVSKAEVDMTLHNNRIQRENILQATWRGRSYYELIDTFGAPRAVLEIPRREHVKTDIVVYGINDQLSRCIDAFVIVDDYDADPFVKDYFCR